MTYDFVIVGAGSAGCVLADRLTANGKYSVLLLEAGGSDMRFFIQMPLGYGKTFFDPAVNWMYRAEPDPGLGGQRDYWPRGKVLGGSSSINAMVYIRGDKRDFEEWEAAGNPGWGWDPVSAAYRAIEDYEGADPAINGKGGPLRISQLGAGKHPLCDPYIEAAKAMGLPFNPNFNGVTQEGVGLYDCTIKGGRRLFKARNEAFQFACRDGRAGDATGLRGDAGDGRRICPTRPDASCSGGAGGDPVGRRDQQPATLAAFWDRPVGPSEDSRHCDPS